MLLFGPFGFSAFRQYHLMMLKEIFRRSLFDRLTSSLLLLSSCLSIILCCCKRHISFVLNLVFACNKFWYTSQIRTSKKKETMKKSDQIKPIKMIDKAPTVLILLGHRFIFSSDEHKVRSTNAQQHFVRCGQFDKLWPTFCVCVCLIFGRFHQNGISHEMVY